LITEKEPINKVIGIFGEVLVDVFPDASVLGGAPFNVARHLKAFGMHPVFITRTGQDDNRRLFLKEMQKWKLDVSGLQVDSTYPTGQVQVHMTDDGHTFEILPNQAYDYIHAGIAHMMTMALKPSLVYFGTLAQRAMPSRLALDKFLADGKCPRFLDINLRSPWYNKHTVKRSLQRSDIVKLNDDELNIVGKYFKLEAPDAEALANLILKEFNLTYIIVTQGKLGAWITDGETVTHCSELPQSVKPLVDTVGAGDAFASVCILGEVLGWDIEVTLNRAHQFASAICRIRGGAPDSLSFYDSFKLDWSL